MCEAQLTELLLSFFLTAHVFKDVFVPLYSGQCVSAVNTPVNPRCVWSLIELNELLYYYMSFEQPSCEVLTLLCGQVANGNMRLISDK